MKKRILSALVSIGLLAGLWSGSVLAEQNKQEQYIEYTEEIGEMYGIQPEFLQAVCFCESTWRPDAVSSTGCVGLAQISPSAHKDRMKRLGVTNLKDPYSNILVSADYLAELFEEYGDEPLEVCMVYNMGDKGAELFEQGIVSKYAESVISKSAELEREHGK